LTDFVHPVSLNEDGAITSLQDKRQIPVTEGPNSSPLLPFRTTLRTTTTTTTTTTTEPPPQDLLTRLLSEAAAPLAGLSAATLAYSAAAMLPVWLPAALGRRRRAALGVELEGEGVLWRALSRGEMD
jgi:hypothetical protein